MKFFVCSDIHSAYTPWMKALNEAGFDANNDDHKIIVCGDLFDRMDETKEVYKFALDMINKDKLIYISGNHEDLMTEMLDREYSLYHDRQNGTVKSFYQLCNAYPEDMENYPGPNDIVGGLLKPLFDKAVNYFETKNYIFVHAWVPLTTKMIQWDKWTKVKSYEFNPDWRNATDEEWMDAKWGNPFEFAEEGLLPDKTIVFGHFHVSYARKKYHGEPEFGEDANFDIYYGDGYIALDSCVAYSDKLNCLVVEDDLLDG